MAERIGETVPAPLRFELGRKPAAGDPTHAVLLVTVGEDRAPRVAVLSPASVNVAGDRRIRIELRAGSTTAANLARDAKALIWCVLDAAAYSICGTCTVSGTASDDSEYAAFELSVADVYRDFEPASPMIAPPTYRAPST
jgi:hypothetical protein